MVVKRHEIVICTPDNGVYVRYYDWRHIEDKVADMTTATLVTTDINPFIKSQVCVRIPASAALETQQSIHTTPLSVLLSREAYAWLLNVMKYKYGKYGLSSELIDETLEILASDASQPEVARTKVLIKFDYSDPNTPFGQCISEFKKDRYKNRVDDLTAYIKGNSIADIGCSDNAFGEVLLASRKTGATQVIGTDVVEVEGMMAAEGLSFKLQPKITTIPIESETQDTATLFFVLHHCRYEQQLYLIKEIYRILNPGAGLIVYEDTYSTEKKAPQAEVIPEAFLDEYNNLSEKDKIGIIKFGEWVNKRIISDREYLVEVFPRSVEAWANMFERAGFVVEKTYLDFPEGKDLYPRGIFMLKKPADNHDHLIQRATQDNLNDIINDLEELIKLIPFASKHMPEQLKRTYENARLRLQAL